MMYRKKPSTIAEIPIRRVILSKFVAVLDGPRTIITTYTGIGQTTRAMPKMVRALPILFLGGSCSSLMTPSPLLQETV
jgi:hypothetical protein